MKVYGDDSLVKAVLDDHLSADVEPRVKTTLTFLQKLTLEPWAIVEDDLVPVREAGVTDEAIAEAIRVCFCFNVIDRLADAFDFDAPGGSHLKLIEFMLIKLGYGGAALPG